MPKGATGVSVSAVSFDVADYDLLDELHFGALNLGSLSLSVDPTGCGRFEEIVADGEVLRDRSGREYAALVVPKITLTGTSLTGTTLTGRHRNRLSVLYVPRELFADGTRVGVHVEAQDRYGYELEETYYFTMSSWQLPAWPTLSFSTSEDTGLLTVIPFFLCALGESYSRSAQLWWGKDNSLDVPLDDVIIQPVFGASNAQGGEIIANGYARLRVDDSEYLELAPDSEFHLGPMNSGDHKTLTIELAIPEDANTRGQVMFGLETVPVRASITGARLSGTAVTGGQRGWLSSAYTGSIHVFASVISAYTKDYFQQHFIASP